MAAVYAPPDRKKSIGIIVTIIHLHIIILSMHILSVSVHKG